MSADDGNRTPAPAATPQGEPTPPPIDPAERPRIEPTDALPTEDHEEPSLLDEAKALLTEKTGDEESSPTPAETPAAEPTPPPADPADRPRIEPTDALPTDDQ